MVAVKDNRRHIIVSPETYERFVSLASNTSLARYLDYLSRQLSGEPYDITDTVDKWYKKDGDGKLLKSFERAFWGSNKKDSEIDRLRELSGRRGKLIRDYDYDYQERYFKGLERVDRLLELAGINPRYRDDWRLSHGSEILEYYKTHCPDATAKRYLIRLSRLNMLLYKMAGIPSNEDS